MSLPGSSCCTLSSGECVHRLGQCLCPVCSLDVPSIVHSCEPLSVMLCRCHISYIASLSRTGGTPSLRKRTHFYTCTTQLLLNIQIERARRLVIVLQKVKLPCNRHATQQEKTTVTLFHLNKSAFSALQQSLENSQMRCARRYIRACSSAYVYKTSSLIHVNLLLFVYINAICC